MRQIMAVNDANNSLHVWRNTQSDFQVDLIWRNQGCWSGWIKGWNKSSSFLNIVGINDLNNGIGLWAVGTDSKAYHAWRNRGFWSSWVRGWNNAPSLRRIYAVHGEGSNYVWGIGADNTVSHTWRNNGFWTTTWAKNWNGAPKLQDMHVVSGGGRVYVWGIGMNGEVYLNLKNAGNWTGWSTSSPYWNVSPPLKAIAAFIRNGGDFNNPDVNNGIHFWGIGIDDTLYYTTFSTRQNGGNWSGWARDWNGAPKLRSVIAIQDAKQDIYVWGIGLDDSVHLTRYSGGTWSAWQKNWNKSPATQSITPINDANDSLHVWAIGKDGKVHLTWRNQGAWSDWMKDWK